MSNQVGVYLVHFLRNESELWDASRVKFVLVMERDRLERQDCFTRLVHRLDILLVEAGGNHRSKVTIAINDHADATCDGYAVDPGNVGVSLCCRLANANSLGLARVTFVANIDVI